MLPFVIGADNSLSVTVGIKEVYASFEFIKAVIVESKIKSKFLVSLVAPATSTV